MTSPLNAPSAPTTQRFVRSAWAVLLVQLAAAVAAVAVTAWAAFQVRPLLAQRDRLTAEIANKEKRLARIEESARALSAENERLSGKLANAREASHYVSLALQQYHNRRYADAIALYDQALKLDPENAYVLDLKSYSQFRKGDLEGALGSIEAALQLQPDYIYGYTEWTRYACARCRAEEKDPRQPPSPTRTRACYAEALQAFDAARARSPMADELYRRLLREDGQFASLCARLRSRFEGGTSATQP
jgi:tetratricopeptide (TPR) repeat protein